MRATTTTTGTDHHNYNHHNYNNHISAVSGRTQSPSIAPAKASDLKICMTDFQIVMANNDHYYNNDHHYNNDHYYNRHHRRDNNINHLHYNSRQA